MEISFADIALAFTAGVITFLSPCLLPLVPGYLAFVAGDSRDAADPGTGPRVIRPLAFIAGFTVIFVALGAAASPIGRFLRDHIDQANLIGGTLIILLGLLMLFEHRLPVGLLQRVGFSTGSGVSSTGGAALFGMTFGFAWSPCIGPTLGAALTLAGGQEAPWQGAFLLFVFSMGLGLPFLLVSLGADAAQERLAPLKRHMGRIRQVAGILLIVFGIIIATGLLAEVSADLQRATPGFFTEL